MKKTLYIALISVLALTTSCAEDVLNPVPSNAVSDSQIFSSVESATTALNSGMAYIGHYFSMSLGTIMAEVMGEDAAMTSGSFGIPTYNWNLYSYTYSQVVESDPWWFGYANYIWPPSSPRSSNPRAASSAARPYRRPAYGSPRSCLSARRRLPARSGPRTLPVRRGGR